MKITNNIAKYIDDKKINLSKLSRKAKVSYAALYTSLKNKDRQRPLRADELIKICKVLEKDPRDFL